MGTCEARLHSLDSPGSLLVIGRWVEGHQAPCVPIA